MAQLRFKGFAPRSTVQLTNVTVGADSGSLTVTNFRQPQVCTQRPRIIGQSFDETWSLDETSLTGITARQWSVVGGSNLGTAATQDVSANGGSYVQCIVTCDQGVLTTPPKRVYETTMMLDVDLAVANICPHNDLTSLAIADGDWSNPATWTACSVPRNGSRVLIPHGRNVTYDMNDPSIRLDWVRVDGTLAWALDQNTYMKVEHLISTRGSVIEIGTPGNRLPAEFTAEIVVSGRDYRNATYEPTDMNVTQDPELWGRGVVSKGSFVVWGKDVLHGAFSTAPLTIGAISVTLEKVPTGWTVGDTIVITPTQFTNGGPSEFWPNLTQEEERVIATIVGNTITWLDPLDFNHNAPSSAPNNQDIRPYVFLKDGRNVKFSSEVTSPTHRRGHCAVMHQFAEPDLWQASFLDMGRTDKSRPSSVKDANGNSRFYSDDTSGLEATLNATRSGVIPLSHLTPYAGLRYHMNVFATDADSSSFVPGAYNTNFANNQIFYIAVTNDTWEDVRDGLLASFATWIAGGGRSTSVLNLASDAQGILVTSTVTTATDTLRVAMSAQIWAEAFTAQSNLQGRYSLHAHHMGTDRATAPQIVGCYADNAPGWSMVHHFAKVDFRECVNYKFFGAGLVAESGNELGQWFDCVSCKSTRMYEINGYRSRAKTNEGPWGTGADNAKFGWGFFFRSRAMVFNECKSFATPTGFVGYHRDNDASTQVGETRDLNRADIDLQTLSFFTTIRGSASTTYYVDYPIVHFDGNLSSGDFASLMITKEAGTQGHNLAIQLSRFTNWGSESVSPEYIQHYNFVNSYSAPASMFNAGFTYGGNVYHSGFLRCVSEGGNRGVFFGDSGDAEQGMNLFDDTNDPRYWVVGHTFLGPTTNIFHAAQSGGRQPGENVTFVLDDDRTFDLELDPSDTFPLVIGNFDPRTNTWEPPLNADGKHVDNISAGMQIAPILVTDPGTTRTAGNGPAYGTKASDSVLWRGLNPGGIDRIGDTFGFWTYAGEQVLVAPVISSDRVTGRIGCVDKLWRLKRDGGANYSQAELESNPGWTHNGTYTYNANAITGSDIEIRVNPNSTNNVIDVETLASLNQNGVTTGFRLDNTWGWRDYRAPNKGTASLDVANCTVTYTPVPKQEGVDTMYVLAYREGRYKTIGIRILIASADTGLTTPVVDTHFSAADSATAGAMDVTLLARPDVSKRGFEYVEYSTDAGATWRKLTNLYPRTRITVSLASDGTALGTGAKTIRIRYVTDYDYATSTASGDDNVTVT